MSISRRHSRKDTGKWRAQRQRRDHQVTHCEGGQTITVKTFHGQIEEIGTAKMGAGTTMCPAHPALA